MSVGDQGRAAVTESLLFGGGIRVERDQAGRVIAVRPARDLFAQARERVQRGMRARMIGDAIYGPGQWRPVRDEDGIVVDVEPLRPPEPLRGLFADRVIVDEYEQLWGPEREDPHAEVRRIAAKHLPEERERSAWAIAAAFDVPNSILGLPDPSKGHWRDPAPAPWVNVTPRQAVKRLLGAADPPGAAHLPATTAGPGPLSLEAAWRSAVTDHRRATALALTHGYSDPRPWIVGYGSSLSDPEADQRLTAEINAAFAVPPPDGAEVMRNVRRAMTDHRMQRADRTRSERDPGALLVAPDVAEALKATVTDQSSWPAPGAATTLFGLPVEVIDHFPPGMTYLEPWEQTAARRRRAHLTDPLTRSPHRGDLMAELVLPLPTTGAGVADCLEALARQVGRVDDLRLASDVHAAVLAVKVADGHDPAEGLHYLQGVPVQEDALLPPGTWAADEDPVEAAQRAANTTAYPEPPHVVNAREEAAATA